MVVLDSSIGVKWFKPETGRVAALELLDQAGRGEIALVAPVHFAHEVLSVVRRFYSTVDVMLAWEMLSAAGLTLMPLTDEIVAESAAQCEKLGCSFYDGLAPALAALLDSQLASADARAHGAFPGVFLIE